MESTAGSQHLEGKLRELLTRIQKQGFEIARTSESLADKINGSIPQPDCNNACEPCCQDTAHSLLDSVWDALGNVFGRTEVALQRAHASVGPFGDAPQVVKCCNDALLQPGRLR